MIVTTTFRHGTQDPVLKNRVQQECVSLVRFMPQVTRVQVVFGKETHHRKSDCLVTCHIALSLSGRQPVNIYERCRSPGMAFDKAKDKAASTLSRIHAVKSNRNGRFEINTI